jgi:hypothetical protein
MWLLPVFVACFSQSGAYLEPSQLAAGAGATPRRLQACQDVMKMSMANMTSLRIPFPRGPKPCKVIVPPSAYPGSISDYTLRDETSMLEVRYTEIWSDMRSRFGYGPEEGPFYQDFVTYAKVVSPDDYHEITQKGGAHDGEELWIRLFNVFLHHAKQWSYRATALPGCVGSRLDSCVLVSCGLLYYTTSAMLLSTWPIVRKQELS